MRSLLLILLLMSGVTFADQPRTTVNREKYERVIEKQFPGFRIMREDDFVDMYKGQLQDGKSGSLVFGNFNSDKYLDFAAYLIGAKRKYQADGKTLLPPDVTVYDGAIVICYGGQEDIYVCERMLDTPHGGKEYNEIVIVPRSTYDCMEYEGKTSHITAQFDSIGKYSESGGAVYVHQPDGKYKKCVNSD
jgi:hypothetical protein